MQLAYGYDAQGRHISKTVQGGTPTQYLYDGQNVVQEMQGSTVNPILVGLGIDERYARNDVIGRIYFLVDMLNSTIALTDITGAIRQQYSYDPYGNVTQSDTTTGFTNPYQYTGREADTAGLYYYRARYYSPMMGGFISEDPITFDGGQLSFYAYASGNPIVFRDPSGHFIVEAGVGFVLGGAFGYVSGLISGDTGDQLWHDAAAGAITGGLMGLTDGASLLGAGLNFGIGAGGEYARQEWNYGCVTSAGDIALAGGLGAIGGGLTGGLNGIAQDGGAELTQAMNAANNAAGDTLGDGGGALNNYLQNQEQGAVSNPLGGDFRNFEQGMH